MKYLLTFVVLLLSVNANAAPVPIAFFDFKAAPTGGTYYEPYGSYDYSTNEVIGTSRGSKHYAFLDQVSLFAKGTLYVKANENITVRISRFSKDIDSDFFNMTARINGTSTYVTGPMHIFVKKGSQLKVSFSGMLEYWGQEIGVKATASPAIEPVPLPASALLLAPAFILLTFKPNRRRKHLQTS